MIYRGNPFVSNSSNAKPCPFCGGEALVYCGEDGWGVWCTKCGATIPSNRSRDAESAKVVEVWNRRAKSCEEGELRGDEPNKDSNASKNGKAAVMHCDGTYSCRFCGGHGRVDRMDYGGFLRDDEYRVRCDGCGASTDWESSDDNAVYAWNRIHCR